MSTAKDQLSPAARTYKYTRKSEQQATSTGTALSWTSGVTSSSSHHKTNTVTTGTVSGSPVGTSSKTWFLSNSTSAEGATTQTETDDSLEMPGLVRESAVDLSKLREKCESLLPYVNMHKYKLPPAANKVFMEVVGLGIRVGGTEQYDEFYDITNSVFSKYTSAGKGSVAYQFIGCKGSKHPCHEDCAGNFPEKGYTDKSFCETHVGVYQEGNINIHYSPAKPCNVLLLHSKSSVSINKKSAKKLKDYGIASVRVNVGGEITTHSVDKILECKKGKKTAAAANDCYEGGWDILFVIIVVVVIIILLCAAVGMYKYYSQARDTKH